MKMAVLQPFFSDTLFSKSLCLSSSYPIPKGPSPIRPRTLFAFLHQPSEKSYLSRNHCLLVKNSRINCKAVAEQLDGGLLSSSAPGTGSDEESKGEIEKVNYDWTEEWYPLYLTENVPEDAPLGLTVFDKQLVLYRDGNGELRCFEDRCPHRLAKLSEGQLIDGRLECLYHGWQFCGDGKCAKIPQLSSGATIPRSACLKTYEIRDSQGVVWVWMSDKIAPRPEKIPWFEIFAKPGCRDVSTTHELPYDHSILLENLMDPAHVPISHDRTDFTAKREDAGPLFFSVTERTDRGFSGWWGKEKDKDTPNYIPNFLRFQAPCVLQNSREIIDENGEKLYFCGLFLCRPSGQGKSMLIVRFGNTRKPSGPLKYIPEWYFHQNASKVFEQDMGFLSSQNEILMKEKVPTKELYINLKSSDTWVAEYRKWMDKVGHGMPYYFGHNTISPPKVPAVVEHAPAGFAASISASQPAKGGIGSIHAPNLSNRYFRHVVHCKRCRNVFKALDAWKTAFSAVALVSTALAIFVSTRQWKAFFLLSTSLCLAAIYACSTANALNTTNFIRTHRRLLAKLSEGQLIDGRLECLYHGWQFDGDGKCAKIPQLSSGATIPRSACLKTYEIRDSQGVVWVWMSDKIAPRPEKIPWFEIFAKPGCRDVSTTHELPYDHSILLENLMDPAHVPISHDRTDFFSKREDAGPLFFSVAERTDRGFSGWWGMEKDKNTPNYIPNLLRFQAPCVLQNNREIVDQNGEKLYFCGLFLCRPSGQGRSMLIVRFGNTRKPSGPLKYIPEWYFHQNASKVFEQDMGFLSSQNEILMKEKVPTKELYINLKSSDTWVAEYRKWMDKVGHGMPYYFGHNTISPPKLPAVVEHAPAGFAANISASQPAKGGIGSIHAPNLSNRYFRHVVHCKRCRNVFKALDAWKTAFSAVATVSTALAIFLSTRQWKAFFLLSTSLCLAAIYACSTANALNTTNFIRTHRRL